MTSGVEGDHKKVSRFYIGMYRNIFLNSSQQQQIIKNDNTNVKMQATPDSSDYVLSKIWSLGVGWSQSSKTGTQSFTWEYITNIFKKDSHINIQAFLHGSED